MLHFPRQLTSFSISYLAKIPCTNREQRQWNGSSKIYPEKRADLQRTVIRLELEKVHSKQCLQELRQP